MSNNVRLNVKLPNDERWNGLDAIQQDLLQDPLAVRGAFVRFDVVKTTYDPETGVTTPTVRIRGFEPLGLVSAVSDALEEEFLTAYKRRTGNEPLPLDVVEAVDGGAIDDED